MPLTLETGKMINDMVKESILGQMATIMRAATLKITEKVMES